MLTSIKERKDNQLTIQLSGTIDEQDKIPEIIGDIDAPATIICKDVARINSVGTRAWIKFFTALKQKGATVRFQELSDALVEQLNMLKNFCAGYEVLSIRVPYKCTTCKSPISATLKTADIKKLNYQPPKNFCPNCKSPAEFDNLPEEYFEFAKR